MDQEIINGMADCLSALLWVDWMERKGRPVRGEILGQVPRLSASKRWRVTVECARLYGRIQERWGVDPRVPVCLEAERRGRVDGEFLHKWGYYAVMSAAGNGVFWEDSEDPIPPPSWLAEDPLPRLPLDELGNLLWEEL